MADMPADTVMASLSSNARSRAHSASSDRPSTIGIYNSASPPLSVSPEAAFIAASAASQIVTNSHDTHLETWYDQVGMDPSGEVSLVSNGALRLANNFVDHLLFNILATAKSTTLPSLRSAVIDVLKPKLARDVIASADEELKEYLGGGGIESLARSVPLERPEDWDLELIWKRTRLRCMVYSSLGDMEEEDEDYYMEHEQLNGGVNALAGLVSPPVAIFLTSILECMGEQVLVLAGQAAFARLRATYERQLKDGTQLAGSISDRIIVEELDMERVALDRTLGRIWRAWKKKIRSPTESTSRPFSRGSANGSGVFSQRCESAATETQAVLSSRGLDTTESRTSISHDTHDGNQNVLQREGDLLDPSMLPLPDSDVEATYSDEEENEQDEVPSRPKSWAVEYSLPAQASIKRTPSLPCRKKPRYILVSMDDASNNTNDSSAAHAKTKQLVDSPEVEVDAEAQAQNGVYTSRSIDKATPGALAIGGIAAPNSTDITADVPTAADIREDEWEDAKGHETDGEIEGFVEEPEILTSSRISVGGRSSPIASESGRPTSIILTRSNSVGSVRVIEVPGPRARASSIESNQRSPTLRSLASSRERSTSRTPPIFEENDTSAVSHAAVAKTATGAVLPFAEGRHDAGATLAPPPRNRSPTLASPPIPSHMPVPSKAGVIANTTQEERHESFQRPISGLRSPPLPTLPERSPSRPVYVQSTSIQRMAPESPKFPRPIQSDLPSPARFKPKRTSEESSSTRPADVARNFEELIQSNETLQYTLTPENMRDMDSQSSQPNGSPRTSYRLSKNDDTMMGDNSGASSVKRSISISRSPGLGSQPDVAVNGKYTAGNLKGLQSTSSRNRPGPPPQARDARVSRESMQDFANFIRSTGPPGESGSHANRPPTAGSITTRSITGKSSVRKSSSIEARRGPKLLARDATVNSSKESSELIDFIRQGPPGASGNNPRIPRTVAPFRNTQDSDYMMSAMGGKAIDAVIPNVRTSLASTNITETSAPSSMNSQSALLNRSNRQQSYPNNGFDEDEIAPKRTQRRVRDPYAIDFSDEEDDEYDPIPKPPPKQEESLIDFLNNYPPPAEPLNRPVVLARKKSSSSNLIARLRSGPSTTRYGSGHSRKGSSASDNRSTNSRAGPRTTHTPIIIPSIVDKFNPSVTSLDPPRTTPFKRVPMKKFEPRDAALSSSKTTDLAEFLRVSQPPPQIAAIPPPEDKASSGFSRIFERRKKSAAY